MLLYCFFGFKFYQTQPLIALLCMGKGCPNYNENNLNMLLKVYIFQ